MNIDWDNEEQILKVTEALDALIWSSNVTEKLKELDVLGLKCAFGYNYLLGRIMAHATISKMRYLEASRIVNEGGL